MPLDKKCKCVNFLCADKRLTHLNASDIETKVLLDLFNAGYKNAYMSSMYFVSKQNNDYHRIEIVVPNVGSLRLYQTFVDVLDEQIPFIKVFYSSATNQNIRTRIINTKLLKYASYIIYNAQKYFESHPEHIATNTDVLQRVQSNQILFQKRYDAALKKHKGVLQTFIMQK